MAAATLLCRHAQLTGATFDQSSGSFLITIQGDGVQSYNLEQRQLGSLPLGSRSGLEFQVPSAQHSERAHAADQEQPRLSAVASVVHDRNAKSYSLCLSDPGSATRPIADAPSRLVLPGPAQSCHFLQQCRQHATPGESAPRRCLAAAVVLSDGRVSVTELGQDSTGALHILPSGQQPAPRTVLATSSYDTLLVATQPAAGSPVTLRVLRLPPSVGDAGVTGLSQVKAVTLACPGGAGGAAAHAVPTGLTMSAAFALLQWSNGHATAVHGIGGGTTAAPLRPSTFPLADTVLANGASTSASTPGPAPAPVTASGRKRKNAAVVTDGGAAGGARPRVLCAAVDDRQFVVLDLESAAAQSQVCFSLHDAQFGCPLSSGSLEVDAPLLSLDAAQCSIVTAGPEATVVRLGSAVHALHIRTQAVSLLSLVARLSVTATTSAAAAAATAAGGAPPQAKPGPAAAIGGAGVAKALASLPPPVALDQALLASQASGAAAATSSAVTAAVDDDAQDVVLEPVPAAAISHPEDICNSLIEQLSAAAAAPPPSAPPQALLDSAVSYMAGRRQHGMAVPPQLLALAARGLAAAKQWTQLGTLLQHVPQAGLSGCSEVLVAVAAAQQYALLSRVATCLDDVDPGALVSALQLLLAPTTRSNLAARQQHYCALRESAEARIAEAEQVATAAAAGAPPPKSGGGRAAAVRSAAAGGATDGALALAQCAAAVVDGFSYREVLLHPLLAIPVDAPAVQVALRRLSAPAADTLLAYLAKWVAKYTGGAIGELAACLALPQELLFPYYHQVLEWTRMTIDSNLTRLLMARSPLPALESLEAGLKSAVEGAKRLTMLRGALEHVNAAAALPAAHIAVATQYTAEVLDLRVR